MTEKNPILLYQQQKGKPVIEDVIPEIIADSVKQKTLLDFVTWLRANKMAPQWMGLTNSWAWQPKYRGKTILTITVSADGWIDHGGNSWYVIPYFDVKKYADTIVKENWQSVIWENQSFCVHKNRDGRMNVGCNPKKQCAGGMTKDVFGRSVDGVCCGGGSENINPRFYDPDETVVTCVMRLLELEKAARDGGAENAK
jgi:hypothetical protein